LDDPRDDDNFYDSRENNLIDGYVGLGAGINVRNVRIEGSVKARRIDGDNWDSDKKYFMDYNFLYLFKRDK
jgi:hypothetical protein